MKKFLSFAFVAVLFFYLGAIVCGLPGSDSTTSPAPVIKNITEDPGYHDSRNTNRDYGDTTVSTGAGPNLDETAKMEGFVSPVLEERPLETVLPIYVDNNGVWHDQDMNAVGATDATAFFGRNRAYARVLVALNRVCFAAGFPSRDSALDAAYATATMMPHDVDEYLSYEWILDKMPADYDWCLDDFHKRIAEIDDIDFRLTANSVSSCIVLGKLLEFQQTGAYQTSASQATTPTPEPIVQTAPSTNSVLLHLPLIGDLYHLDPAQFSLRGVPTLRNLGDPATALPSLTPPIP